MRLIDADALKFKNVAEVNGILTHILTAEEIDNAPTFEPFEPDYVGAERLEARQRGYKDGYHNGMEIGKTLNPRIKQGEWIVDKITRAVVCSCCGQSRRDTRTTHIFFCNHCGAEMRKGGSET